MTEGARKHTACCAALRKSRDLDHRTCPCGCHEGTTEGARMLNLNARQIAFIDALPIEAVTVDGSKVFTPGWQNRRADLLWRAQAAEVNRIRDEVLRLGEYV